MTYELSACSDVTYHLLLRNALITTSSNEGEAARTSPDASYWRARSVGSTMRACLLLAACLDAACCLTLPAARVTRVTRDVTQDVTRRHSLLRLSGGGEVAYSFKDDGMVCVVTMAIAEDVRSKDIVYDLSSRELTLGVKGDASDVRPPMIDAEALWGTVRPDDSHWEIDEIDGIGRCVVVELVKKGSEPWGFLLKSQYKAPDVTVTCARSG